jgi:MFS family permease
MGYNPIETGLAFLPLTALLGTASLIISPALTSRFGPRPTALVGLALTAVGLALFARVPIDGSYVIDVFPVMVLLGAGSGVAFPAVMTLAMSGATDEDAGVASGFLNTSLQIGGALGLAVLATVAVSRSNSLVARGDGTASALLAGYHLAFVVAAAIVTTGAVLAAAILRPSTFAAPPERSPTVTEPTAQPCRNA